VRAQLFHLVGRRRRVTGMAFHVFNTFVRFYILPLHLRAPAYSSFALISRRLVFYHVRLSRVG
jgi:hypothetical protein